MTDRSPSDAPNLRNADWLKRPETRRLFAALNRSGFTARAVGGAVRNALLGLPVRDIDIATTSDPDQTMRLAAEAGLTAVPTGIAHGTVTILVDRVPFEVTTLRADVETFGRQARVAFIDDWAADARRRDFTMNALYCEPDGTVVDPLLGYADLAAGRVRFIGDAADRIREDYLRILRFFRFTAEYAQGQLDATGLAACLSQRDGLLQLSRERIRAELLRFLQAPHAVTVVRAIAVDVLTRVLPEPLDVDLMARIAALEEELERPADPLLRLGALTGFRPGSALALKDKLRLSAYEFDRLSHLSLRDPALQVGAPEAAARAYIYRHGPQAFRDGVMIAWARDDRPVTDADAIARAGMPDRWHAPLCPIRGSDVMALGVAPGPRVGRVLADFEDWWITAGFPDDPHEIAQQLARLSQAP